MKEIQIKDFNFNACDKIANDWALLGAGTVEDNNAMTISWAGFGHLWRRDVCYVYVRPTRYTYKYTEREDFFVITFLKDGYKEALAVMGRESGRDLDKVVKAGLTPTTIVGFPTYEEAEYVIVCKKAYVNDIKREEFIDKDVEAVYTDDNIHRQYIGTIHKVYENK